MSYRKNRFKKGNNQKVANATKITVAGVEYRSKLEAFCAKTLQEEGIIAEYEKSKFLLNDKFTFNADSYEDLKKKGQSSFGMANPNIQHITYTPDFVDPKFRWLIECKGMRTDAFTLKWKMFKKYLNENKIKMDLYLPKNQKQVLQTIAIIKLKYK